ncbi:MAG: Sec-independent protein translocase protein TatB [Alphaproteobacteria bacterium]
MFDIGWPELVLIAILSIIVIGPKELPTVLRALGRWAGKARALVREFRSSLEEIANESELNELRRMASGEEDENRIATPPASEPDAAKPNEDAPHDERG